MDVFQAHGVGIPHRAPAICRKPITIQVDDIDIDGAQRVTLFKDAGTFVHQGVDAAIDHFGSGNVALRNSGFGGPLPYEGTDFRISCSATLFVIAVPAGQSLLAIATHLAKTILSNGLANTRFFQVAIFLANPPANIQSGKIARREWTHGHAELNQRVVNGFHVRAFFDQKLGFPPIGPEHAVSDKAPAVSHEHADLAELFREFHASGDDFLTCLFSAHNFEQAHDV